MSDIQAHNTPVREFQGIAVADKTFNSRELKIWLPELQPFLEKEIEAREIETDVSTTSTNGSTSTRSVTTKSYITAMYMADDENFQNPPDIRKGEQVKVFKYGNSNRFYWKSEGRNNNLRRCEDRRISVAASLENVAELHEDNTYYLALETLSRKRVAICTSAADGEKHRYKIEINCDDSTVTITDEKDNTFRIESENTRVYMKNHDNSVVDLNKEDINIVCRGNVTIKAENGDVSIQAGQKVYTESGANTEMKVGANLKTDSASNTELKVGGNYQSTAAGSSTHHSDGGWGVSSGSSGSVSVSHLSITG